MGNTNTFHLFAKPSFVSGMASVLDMAGTLTVYNEHETPEEADCAALFSDWLAVGEDIKNSIKKYEQEYAS